MISFKIYQENNNQVIERLIYPRFKAKITFNSDISDLEDVEMIDRCSDPTQMARAMREAGDFILENSK